MYIIQYVVQGVAWRVQQAVDPGESDACATALPDPVKAPFSSPLQAVTDFTSRHRNFYSGAVRSAFLSRAFGESMNRARTGRETERLVKSERTRLRMSVIIVHTRRKKRIQTQTAMYPTGVYQYLCSYSIIQVLYSTLQVILPK